MYKVVVVEDEELVRQGIVLAVDWAGLDCVVVGEARNGLEGVEVVLRHAPDIVVTDIKMPQLDGVGMIQELRNQKNKSQFIILTAHSDFQYAQSAIKLGVADYLLKPFADGELERAVSTIGQRLASASDPADTPLYALRGKGDLSKYVEQALECIRLRYSDAALSVSGVAEQLGISEGYLSRVFKKETEYTFVNCLTHYRMHTAMTLLKDTRIKVYEVAGQVGYLDTTYFSTVFKRVTGVTPSEFQSRCE